MTTTIASDLTRDVLRVICVFFLIERRPPRSTLFPYTNALPICVGGRRRAPALRHGRPELPAQGVLRRVDHARADPEDRKSTRLNSSHPSISYAVFCLKKKIQQSPQQQAHLHYTVQNSNCITPCI